MEKVRKNQKGQGNSRENDEWQKKKIYNRGKKNIDEVRG